MNFGYVTVNGVNSNKSHCSEDTVSGISKAWADVGVIV